MTNQVELYTMGGIVRGGVARPGRLRELIETADALELRECTFVALRGVAARPAGTLMFDGDELLIVAEPDTAALPIHATWHAVRLVVGPWVVEGELPSMPGFDPGRALTRPSGSFVTVRAVSVRLTDDPERVVAELPAAHVNRYDVERVDADIMLGFFFPGAEIAVDVRRGGASAGPPGGMDAA